MNIRMQILGKLVSNGTSVTAYMRNGVKLQGYVTSFDTGGLLLERDSMTQYVFMDGISTIMPNEPGVISAETIVWE